MGKVPPFSELIAATTRSAVHLETRDAYTPDDPRFLDWGREAPGPRPANPAWSDLVREHTARGVRFRRAGIVSEPLADYIRFEHAIPASSISRRAKTCGGCRGGRAGLCVPLNDFWLLDERVVRFGYFAGNGSS